MIFVNIVKGGGKDMKLVISGEIFVKARYKY